MLVFFLLPGWAEAQSGGRKREGGGTRRKMSLSFKRNVSAGHADQFARSKGRRSLFARMFKKDRPAWVYRPSGNNKKNWRENKYLFTRHRSAGKIENDRYQQRQNARRDRGRVRGNEKVATKKHKR